MFEWRHDSATNEWQHDSLNSNIADALATIRTVQDATGLSIARIDGRIDALSSEVDGLRSDMNRRFDLVDNRFDEVNQRFDRLEKHFDRLETLIITSKPKRKRPQDRE
jgi:hypothetical protein